MLHLRVHDHFHHDSGYRGARPVLMILLLVAVLAPAPAADSAKPALPPGTLRFFNLDSVTFRGAYLGLSPRSRAAQGADRVRQALARNGPGAVEMIKTADGLSVTVDGAYVFRIPTLPAASEPPPS